MKLLSLSWKKLFWGLLAVLVLLLAATWVLWNIELAKFYLFGFQPPEMARAQYTQKDMIGDLGGMKVRIPRGCAEYVEYNGDPSWGEKRKGPVPERTFESKFTSFGIDVRFPEMRCKDSKEMREDYRRQQLKQDNQWIDIGILAGEGYPKVGEKSSEIFSKEVTNSINKPTKYWFSNYEKLPKHYYGLEAYVVTGIDPHTRKLAKDSERTKDVFIHQSKSGSADTYIECNKTYIAGGVANCRMRFDMQPKAKVHIRIGFARHLLPQWLELKQSTIYLLGSFEISNTNSSISKKPLITVNK